MIFCNANIWNEFQLELYFVYDSKYIIVELSIPKGGRKQKEIDVKLFYVIFTHRAIRRKPSLFY